MAMRDAAGVRSRMAIAFACVAVVALGAWGGLALAGGSSDEPDDGAAAHDSSRKARGELQVMGSRYGDVLFDGKGFALYLFTDDKKGKSRCYGACAKAWPPFTTKGKPSPGPGADGSLLGTTKRKNGSKQVTYDGHPLYYYEDDDEVGEILCHDVNEFGGRWLVVQPDGNPAP
jgi:predicted lipoprotein with Yx(FWY)xxD motif